MQIFMKTLSIVISMLFLSHGCKSPTGDQAYWEIPRDKEKFHIFILMGQSNMSGFAPNLPADAVPVKYVLKMPTVYEGEIHWKPAAHPLHNRLRSDRFGLGLPFAIQYLKRNKKITVGLIPLAWGGAEIDRLNQGSKVYADFLKKIEVAKQQGKIKGVLWHQGESDTVDEEKTGSYEQKLHKLIFDIRRDVGDDKLPFIVGNLAEFYGTSNEHSAPDRVNRINRIKQTLRNVPQKIPYTAFVESTHCTSIDTHNVHFDRKSYITLGKRYAEAYFEMGQ